MGAIVKLYKMPKTCRDCPFANKEVDFCRLRNSGIIAGKHRSIRMPLCPLQNEGEYLTGVAKFLRRIKR